MNDEASSDASIQKQMLDAVGDALTAAFIVYDKNDLMIFASRQVLGYFPVKAQFTTPGTRLRDFLGAVYDIGIRFTYSTSGAGHNVSREDWIADRIASHWRERSDTVERHSADRWVRLVKRRLPNGYGISVFSDVSEHKKREEQWRADLERVQLTEEILDTLPFPVFVKDRSLTYVAVNKAYCALWGLDAEELLGRTIFDVMASDVADHFAEADRHVLDTGMPGTVSEQLVRTDGTDIAIVTRRHRVGKPGRYFLVTSMEEIPEQSLGDRSGRGAAAMEASPDDAVAPWSPSGGLDQPPVPMETVLPDRFNGFKVLLVTADLAIEAAAMTTFERLGLESCTVRGDAEQEAFLQTAVAVGVAIDLIIVDTQMSVRSLELAQLHGIDVLALDGFQVSTQLPYLIVRHFNRRKSAAVPLTVDGDDWRIAADADQPVTDRVQVLVAEDNDINRIVFSQILEGLGYSYLVATDGAEAVDFWLRHAPQIVLMDITLPVINGFEAAQRIRALEGAAGRPATPIIGVLTQAFDRDRQMCIDAGMNATIMKPISPDILEAVFAAHLDCGAETSLG